jgi:hypothetical protein
MKRDIPKSLLKAECVSRYVSRNVSQPTRSARVSYSQSFSVAPYRSNAESQEKD